MLEAALYLHLCPRHEKLGKVMYEAARYDLNTSNGFHVLFVYRGKNYDFLKLKFGMQLVVIRRCVHLFSYRKMCVSV